MAVRKRILTYFLKVARVHSCMKLFQCKSCQLMDKTLNYHFMKKNHTYIVNYIGGLQTSVYFFLYTRYIYVVQFPRKFVFWALN